MTEQQPPNKLLTFLKEGAAEPQLGVGKTNSLLNFATEKLPALPPLPEPPKRLSFEELFHEVIDSPMYRTVLFHVDGESQVASMCQKEYDYDRYCPTCCKETPWSTYVSQGVGSKRGAWAGIRNLQNYCKRCRMWENIWLSVTIVDDMDPCGGISTVTKIGQSPSSRPSTATTWPVSCRSQPSVSAPTSRKLSKLLPMDLRQAHARTCAVSSKAS